MQREPPDKTPVRSHGDRVHQLVALNHLTHIDEGGLVTDPPGRLVGVVEVPTWNSASADVLMSANQAIAPPPAVSVAAVAPSPRFIRAPKGKNAQVEAITTRRPPP